VTRPAPELVVTAVVTNEENLKLIAWHIAASGVVTRLGDSGQQAGTTAVIDVAALAPDRLITGARTAAGSLKLITWSLESVGERGIELAASFARSLAPLAQLSSVPEDMDDFSVAERGL
jgi:hypothetical protein